MEHSASLGHFEGPFSSTMNLINPLSPVFRPYALVGLLISPKRDQKGFRGPRDDFAGRTQKFGQISACLPHYTYKQGGIEKAPFAYLRRFLILMSFIDPRIFDSNDIHRPQPGPQGNKQIGGVRCAISQIWSMFREMLGENPANIHL